MTFALNATTAAKLDALPWRSTPRDMRQASKILAHADLDTATPLGAALEQMLHARVAECRDLFRLRGVRARRTSVMQLAGRSLAADPEQILRLECLAPGFGEALLRALSRKIEAWAATGRLQVA